MPSEVKKPEPVAVVKVVMQGGNAGLSWYAASPDPTSALDILRDGTFLHTAAQLEQYAADRVREAEEAIADEYAMRLQADLEHGVRSINEAAADTFQRVYPQLAGFMGWLNDRTLKEQTK